MATKPMNKILMISLVFGLLLVGSFAIINMINFEESLNCNPDIKPQSIFIEGQQYTKATPNHERPCSAPILFGGKP